MILETAVGPVPAAQLVVRRTEQELPCGTLHSTAYYLDGVKVKEDQHVDIREDMMPASGSAQL